MIRTAISPRLATRTFENTGALAYSAPANQYVAVALAAAAQTA